MFMRYAWMRNGTHFPIRLKLKRKIAVYLQHVQVTYSFSVYCEVPFISHSFICLWLLFGSHTRESYRCHLCLPPHECRATAGVILEIFREWPWMQWPLRSVQFRSCWNYFSEIQWNSISFVCCTRDSKKKSQLHRHYTTNRNEIICAQ